MGDGGTPKGVSRRGFLGTSAAATVGGAVGWRGADVLASEASAVQPSSWKQRPPNLIASACDMCGAQCPMWVQTVGAKPVALHANAESTYSGGHICGKAHAGLQKTQLPNRLTTPLMRNAQGVLEPTTWAKAIDFIAARLVAIEQAHGAHAVQVHRSISSQHKVWDAFWKRLVGTPNVFGNDSVCDGTRKAAFGLTMGERRPLPDLRQTRFGVCVGLDYLASTKYLWYASQFMEACEAGSTFWIVDPRFSATAARAVQYGGRWLPIKPGTDALLGMAMGKIVLAEAPRHAEAFGAAEAIVQMSGGKLVGSPLSRGFDAFRARLEAVVLDDAATTTGVARDDMVAMVRGLLRHKRSLVDAWTGVTKKSNGFQTARVFASLAAMTHSIGNEGGLNAQTTAKLSKAKVVLSLNELQRRASAPNNSPGRAATARQTPGPRDKPGAGITLVRAGGFYRFTPSDCNALIPMAIIDPMAIVEEAKRRRGTPRPEAADGYPVKALITAGRNLVNGNSGSNLWRKALRKLAADPLGLVVDVNLFVSDQSALAHVVLPEASHMERVDLFKNNGLWPTLHLRTRATAPVGDSKTMYDICTLLADALGRRRYRGVRFSARDVIEGESFEDIVRMYLNSPRPDWKPRLSANAGKAWSKQAKRGVLQKDGSRVTWEMLSDKGAWQPARETERIPRYRYYAERDSDGGMVGFRAEPKLGKFTTTFDFECPALKAERVSPIEIGQAMAKKAASFDYPAPDQFDPVPGYVPPRYGVPKERELVLNSAGKNQWNCSSKTVHLPFINEKEPHNRMTMHPEDAAARGVRHNSVARVFNRFGSIEVRVNVSPTVTPGSLHLSSGFGQREPETDEVARLRGSNPNELTDNGNIDPVSGGEGLAETIVNVESIA